MEDQPQWTLGYEAEGSDDAAWTLRYGTGADTVVYETTQGLDADETIDAQAWAVDVLSTRHATTVTDWEAHRPSPGASTAYWTAVEK